MQTEWVGKDKERKPKLDHFQQREAIKGLKASETPGAIARTYGVLRLTSDDSEHNLTRLLEPYDH